MKINIKIKDWQFFLLFTVVFLITALVTIAFFHNQRDVENLGVFLFKLLPFIAALLAIAYLPPHWLKPPWSLLLILLSFAVFFAGFIMLISFFTWNSDPKVIYLIMQIAVPYIILCLAFALKLGGGGKKDTMVTGVIGLLFMLSGIEDLAYQVFYIIKFNPQADSIINALPEQWDWASHMSIFLGRVLNKYEAFVFIGVHFAAILAVIYFAYFHKNIRQRLRMRKTKKQQ